MEELINPVEVTVDNHTVNVNFIKLFDEKLRKRNPKLYERYVDDLRIVVKQYINTPRKMDWYGGYKKILIRSRETIFIEKVIY